MAGLRIAALVLGVAAVVMGGGRWTPEAGVLRAAPAPVLDLNLRLTTSEALPPAARRALVSETASIWEDEGIRLRWLSGSESRGGLTLRVLVMPRTVGAPADGEPWPVGELLRFEDSRAIAIASISGARRVIDESERFRLLDLPSLRDYRLGLVLGRAVAHEIGHYLLQSNAHTESGLMRANIGAREFAGPRGASFQLDADAQRRLIHARRLVEVP